MKIRAVNTLLIILLAVLSLTTPLTTNAQGGTPTCSSIEEAGVIAITEKANVYSNDGARFDIQSSFIVEVDRVANSRAYFTLTSIELYIECSGLGGAPDSDDKSDEQSSDDLPSCPEGDQDGEILNHPRLDTIDLVTFLQEETSWGRAGELIVQNYWGGYETYTLDNKLAFAYTEWLLIQGAAGVSEGNRYDFAANVEGQYFSLHFSYPFLQDVAGIYGVEHETLYGFIGYIDPATGGLTEFSDPVQPDEDELDLFANKLYRTGKEGDHAVEDIAQSIEVAELRGELEELLAGTSYDDASEAAADVRSRTISRVDLRRILDNLVEMNDWTLVIYPPGVVDDVSSRVEDEDNLRVQAIEPWVQDRRLADCEFRPE